MVAALRKEMDATALRVRNGIAYARGQHSVQLEPTPKDVVWQRDNVVLHRCRSDRRRLGPPVLAMIGLVSRPNVLDLMPGNTFIGALCEAGFDVYLVDWGVPTEAQAEDSLDVYVSRYLPRVINAARADSGAPLLNLLAYCMGGQLALLYLSQRREHGVRAVVTLAPPVDFAELGPLVEPFRQPGFEPDVLIDSRGLVPASVVGRSFTLRRPTFDVVNYVNLLQKLTDDQALDAHASLTAWARDHLPWPGAAFRQMVQMFVRDNAFVNGTARVNGRPARLSDIDVPILNLIAERDDVVPQASSSALARLVPAELYEEFRIDARHVGLVLGRTAARTTIPAAIDWLTKHSDETDGGRHADPRG